MESSRMTRLSRPGLMMVLVLVSSAAWGTYYAPTRALVLNTVLAAAAENEIQLPLYLDRRGVYVAEIFLEPAADRPRATPGGDAATPSTVDFSVRIVHRNKVLVAEDFALQFAPGDTGRTLFWMDAPRDVPDRRSLTVIVAFSRPGTSLDETYGGVRLRILRKPALILFPR